MLKSKALVLAATAALFAVGCDNGPSTPATQPANSSAPTTPAAPAVPAVTAPATPAMPAAPAAPAVPAAPAAPAAPTPSAAAPEDSACKDMIAKAQKDIAAKNWDAATKDLKDIGSMSDKLSADQKKCLEDLTAKVTEGKAASAMPAIPGLTAPAAPAAPAVPAPTTAPADSNK